MSSPKKEPAIIPQQIGSTILSALTQEEVALMLDAFFDTLVPTAVETALKKLPTDTQQTLQTILHPEPTPGVKTATTASLAKLEQTWSQLWQQWNDIVSEATEEDGKYIAQEEHWEPPYFDDDTFIKDLEAVAEQMQPLLAQAYEHCFVPDVDFGELLIAMAEEITYALPEWIELADERFFLERNLTFCLLQWQWHKTSEQGLDAFAWLQGIREWDEKASLVELNSDSLFDFLDKLPDVDWQRIYQGLKAHQEELLWQKSLTNIHSDWYQLYLTCQEKYAPELYLQQLRATISQEWRNGLPVIEALLAQQAYPEGQVVLEEMFASLLKSSYREVSWTPETGLLVTISDRATTESNLLRYYQQIATALNQQERMAALELQLIAVEHRFNWSIMWQALTNAPVSETTRNNLYQSWRSYILRLAPTQDWGWQRTSKEGCCWLSWLLDSLANPDEAKDKFQEQIEQWLAETPAKSLNLVDLRLLTADVAQIKEINCQQYPHFFAVVIIPQRLKTADSESRQALLQQVAPSNLWEQVMACWQRHLGTWIPSPEAASKSDYTQQAQWMAACHEIAPDTYEELMAQWRIKYKQRRNLWRDLAQFGLKY